ncbi:MAG: SLC13 family permease [Deferribacteraceae bacterium]|jgi:di/tricarboxylate transporter|nr:SLC13 family permease [Deferribacteraceae bacterium]
MLITLAVLFISVVLFVHGRIRSDLVAVCALLALVLTGILTPSEAFKSFSDPVILMMAGLFIIGSGILRTGLAALVSAKMLALAKKSEIRLLFLVIIVTTFIGAFISNSGTVALMLPIVISMTMNADINPRKLLLPLSYASTLGGMFTLIGTTPNLVIAGVLADGGYHGIKFFSFAPVGCVTFAVGALGIWLLSKIFLSDKVSSSSKPHSKSLSELAGEYMILANTTFAILKPGSRLADNLLKNLNITGNYSVSLIKIIRKKKSGFFKRAAEELPRPDTILHDYDIIEVLGSEANTDRFIAENDLIKTKGNIGLHRDWGIAEALIMPASRLVGVAIKNSGFREKYRLNILGINHNGVHKFDGIKDEIMRNGDAILLQGSWSDLARLDEDRDDIVLVGRPLEEAAKITLNEKAPIAAGILFLMIASMVANILPPVVAVLSAAALMVASGCIKGMEEAYKAVSWQSVVLIAAMMPMSTALEKTGAVVLAANTLASSLGGLNPIFLLAGVYFGTSVLTLFISNTATAVLFAPIAFSVAETVGLSPYPFLMAVTVGASMCFMSPFSTPPNVMVMAPGRYTFSDYVKVGGPLQLFMGIVMVLVLPLIFPFTI